MLDGVGEEDGVVEVEVEVVLWGGACQYIYWNGDWTMVLWFV